MTVSPPAHTAIYSVRTVHTETYVECSGSDGPWGAQTRCSATFNPGTPLTLFAAVKTGSVADLSAWTGPCAAASINGPAGRCDFTIARIATVSATLR